MKRYLLDTGSAADWIFRRTDTHLRVRAALSRGRQVGTAMPVAGELLAGAEFSSTRDKNRPKVVRALKSMLLWPFDWDAAEEYGRLFAHLRRVGRPMQQFDIQIAAVALTLGHCTVVTRDGDFRAIQGLRIEDWSTG